MDLTQMQQAVMDSVESGASFPQEQSNSISHPDDTITTNHDSTSITSNEAHSYDELFPELPNAGLKSDDRGASVNTWAKNSDMRIASSVITQVFRIPYEERAKIEENKQFGENASSRMCTDITSKTGAHIEFSSAKNQSLTFVITGKRDEVHKAKLLATERFQTMARQTIKIPQEHFRFLLGKKGKKLHELEESTGTKISLPNSNDPNGEVVVKGPKEGIEKAVHEIKLISDEQSKQAYEVLDIPKMYHPFINPSSNEKIAQIVADNTVRVNMPPPSVNKSIITVAGEKEGVLYCKELMTNIFDEMDKICQTISVEVPKAQHRNVLGYRGSNQIDILKSTGVSVEIPSIDSQSDTITLRGPQEKLGCALTLVYEKAKSVVIATIECPVWLHKYIIEKKGAYIKEISQNFPKLYIELSDTGIIKIDGPREDVEIVKEKFETKIRDLLSANTYDEISVDPNYYGFIIGKNGANIKKLRGDYNVNINITSNNGKSVMQLDGAIEDLKIVKQELLDLISKLENEREKEIRIEARLHRLLIGPKGERIKEIREKFNKVQFSFPDFDSDKADIVKIRGPKEDVERCHRYMTKLVKDLLEDNYQIRFTIYRHFIKFIIGKAGANIKKIREETNTKIDMPSDGDEVTITGRKENCDKAKQMLQKIQNEMANIVEIDVIIPSKFHNYLIGTGGKLIRSISEDCGGVSIKFPSAESKSDKVSIRGPKEDCLKAKGMLVELSNEKQLASCEAEVRVKPEFHRFLIGKGGVKIKQLREKSGAQIVMPNESDLQRDVITIIGKKESVEIAKKEIESIVSELDKVGEEKVMIDQIYYRHFIGKRGEMLRDISDQFGGVRISFPKQGDDNLVTIRGVKECVEGAKARLLEIVEELKATVVETVEIAQKHHRALMGPRGSRVIGLEREFGVHIKFPDRDMGNGEPNPPEMNGDGGPRPQDIVRIRGRMEKCLAAKEALLAAIPIEFNIDVPFKYHRFLIGQKRDGVRGLMEECDVQINFPPVQDKSDVVVIIGAPSNVEKAKEAVAKKVEKLAEEEEDRQARSFELQLRIPPQFHFKVIGRKGVVVTKLRQKYDVNIHFPERGSADEDLITITGYEKNCHEAKKGIMDITGDLDNIVRKEVEIDARVHSRLIGARGWSIRKVMEEYKVEITFPREDDDPNMVAVTGNSDAVDDCIDNLLNLTEEYLQDIYDREETKKYIMPSGNNYNDGNDKDEKNGQQGFVVSGAPWAQSAPNMDSSEDFPSMGSSSTLSSAPSWGPRRN